MHTRACFSSACGQTHTRQARSTGPAAAAWWRGGEPTSRAQRRGTVLERSSGSKPLSPGMVPSSAGAAFRKGIALDFSCQDRGWGCCVKPSGAGALLAQKTAREFQRLPDLHDDTAAASAAHQAGGLVGQSRVRDDGQHFLQKGSEVFRFNGQGVLFGTGLWGDNVAATPRSPLSALFMSVNSLYTVSP